MSKETVKIPPPKLGKVKLTIKGVSPLLMHRFDSKVAKEMEEQQTGVAKNKRGFRNKEAEYQASMYIIPGTKTCGIPAGALKSTAVNACRFVEGIPMTIAKGAFHIIASKGNLLPIKGTPVLDESIVKIGKFPNKTATPRFRARFDEWSCSFEVQFMKSMISVEQLVNLFENAGFAVGLLEYRPERGGSFGRFTVVD